MTLMIPLELEQNNALLLRNTRWNFIYGIEFPLSVLADSENTGY
jgi:hypothetical protein